MKQTHFRISRELSSGKEINLTLNESKKTENWTTGDLQTKLQTN